MTTNSTINTKQYYTILIFALITIVASGCMKQAAPLGTRHQKPKQDANNEVQIASVTQNIKDSIIGGWKVQKVEIPDMRANTSMTGNQKKVESQEQQLIRYQSLLSSLSVTFNSDKKYQSFLSGKTDTGTWLVNKDSNIETYSTESGSATILQVISISSSTLVAKYNIGDAILQLTFIKQ